MSASSSAGIIATRSQYVSPSVMFNASNAWTASRVTTGGGKTLTWLPLKGAVTLAAQGVTQPSPAAVASLNNRLAVTWNTATGCYFGDVPDPTLNQTLFWVGRVSTAGAGLLALTNGGTINTGTSLIWDPGSGGAAFARRQPNVDSSKAIAPSQSLVILARITAAGCKLYVNSRTPVTVATAAAGYNQTRCLVGALSSALVYAQNGAATAEAGIFPRDLSDEESEASLIGPGRYYGITIA